MSNQRVIGVVGSGTMGAGIAQSAAAVGFTVNVLDVRPELVKTAFTNIAERLDGRVARGKMTAADRDAMMARLHVADGYDAFKGAECVIEAAPEDLVLKQKVFRELDRVASPRTLLATNTSCLSVTRIGDGLKHADRFLGMHFFNPAPVMELVELVQAPATSEKAMVDARSVCTKLRKTPVKVKDSPGFIGNRVNRPFYLEAMRLLEQGEADIGAIDAAVRDVGGFKMGPFELLDLIGLDVNLAVTESIFEAFGKPARFTPSAIQRKLVSSGRLGRKSGCGFYDYANGDPTPAYEVRARASTDWKPSPALNEFAALIEKPADRSAWICARILLAVVNEAARAADTIALPRDVDTTMRLGFNYPQGPLATADHAGLDVVQRLLAEFHRQAPADERFAPNPLLDRQVAAGHLGEKSSRGFLYHAL